MRLLWQGFKPTASLQPFFFGVTDFVEGYVSFFVEGVKNVTVTPFFLPESIRIR